MRLIERQIQRPVPWPAVAKAACVFGVVFASLVSPGYTQDVGTEPVEAGGEEEAPPEDPIPKAFPVDRYLDIWKKSPFQREVTPAAQPMKQSFARDYAVLGYIGFGPEPVVTLINKKTRNTLQITSEEKDGFRVVEVVEGNRPRDLTVTVSKDGETADLTFDDSFLNTPAKLAQVSPAAAGAGGKKMLNPTGRVLPGGSRPIVRPNANGAGGGTVNAAGGASTGATVQKPPQQGQSKPPPPPVSTSGGSIVDDVAPSPASRRRVVLPTAKPN